MGKKNFYLFIGEEDFGKIWYFRRFTYIEQKDYFMAKDAHRLKIF
jgi:hypothetical protein